MSATLPLPLLFQQMCAAGKFRRARGSWSLRSEHDCYGNRLESELACVFCDAARRADENRKLPTGFEADGIYGESLPEFACPGAIDDILDFGRILMFAESSDGAPFCLDYRENLFRPCVIWWDDVYWRKLTPDFADFCALFDFDQKD